jgi:DNA-binding CsgD family transcriptional regulator
MATPFPLRGRVVGLTGRRRECDVLDGVVASIRAGQSRVLVLRGEPGVGKTALLDHLVERASGLSVARAVGVQSEMELAFAGLHQLLTPMLHRLDGLPVPQRDALRTAFGVSSGPPPDRFLLGLAVLSLLSEAAEEQPLLCVVDDEQWLDRASAQLLAFVARRVEAESVGLVFAARTPSNEISGLPELAVEGLREAEAHALLDSVLTAPLDSRIRDQIVSETHGLPLALLEQLQELTPAELAGGFGLPAGVRAVSDVEDRFRRRLDALPAETRRLLQLAAADPTGDPLLVWQAAERLGIPARAATPAAQSGLLEFGVRVRFRHPLVRSAAYRSATVQERQNLHLALAEVTDPQVDPDRRAWHRAQAAPGPDEDVARELERCADRHVSLAREVGALSELPLALTTRIYTHLLAGELNTAACLTDEVRAATEATGRDLTRYGALGLAACRGHEAEATAIVEADRKGLELRGEGIGMTVTAWATALLYNGLGRYERALAAAQEATAYPHDMGTAYWALGELVEAAARTGIGEAAADAHQRLRALTHPSGTDWALGFEARVHALVSEGEAAESLYRDAIDRLRRTRIRLDLARAHLLYGEWLRRENRRVDARAQLRTAHEMFSSMGADGFADRARRELLATGERVRRRTVETRGELTAQEAQIARLARDGLSNPEIGTRLFLSPRTVQYHLRKVFTKLGVSSRNQLEHVLTDGAISPPV